MRHLNNFAGDVEINVESLTRTFDGWRGLRYLICMWSIGSHYLGQDFDVGESEG